MQSTSEITEPKQLITTFKKRLDFYWQFISVYAIALILYGVLRGSIDNWTFSIAVLDPVVLLLLIFIIITFGGLVINSYKRQEIIITTDSITLKNRYRETTYTKNEIIKIALGKDRITKVKGSYKVIKIKVNTRRRIVRIRPSSFYNDKELVKSVTMLKKNINK